MQNKALEIIRTYRTRHNVVGVVYELDGVRCASFVGKDIEDVEAVLEGHQR